MKPVRSTPSARDLDLSGVWKSSGVADADRAQAEVAKQLWTLEQSLVRVHAELSDADKDGSLLPLRNEYRQRIEDVRAMLRGMAK